MFLMRPAVTQLVHKFLLLTNQNSKYLQFIYTLLALHNFPYGWKKFVCVCAARLCACVCVHVCVCVCDALYVT